MRPVLIITITDGWAFRWLFTSSAYSVLSQKYKIRLYVNEFYMSKLKQMDNFDIYLLPKASKKFLILNALLNESFRNNNKLKIQKYYLSKYSVIKRFLSWVTSLCFMNTLLTTGYNYLLNREVFQYSHSLDITGVEKAIFLSPYYAAERVLSAMCSRLVSTIFVLPSWDNIYKYHLSQTYDSYVVWGVDQSCFLKVQLGIQEEKIKVLGSITQHVFAGMTSIETSVKDYVLYCTIGQRLFPNEYIFVSDLARLFRLGVFGEKKLMIRLHPADRMEIYEDLISDSCIISSTEGVRSLHDWDVDDAFFTHYYAELSNASLVINVASTVTLDCLSINQNTVNYNPVDYDIPFDYYSFEHYTSLKDVVVCCRSFAEVCDFIRRDANGIIKNTNSALNLNFDGDVSNYCYSLIGD